MGRRITSQLVAIRTGDGFFRSYMARIPGTTLKIPGANCTCGAPEQTPKHLLLHCGGFKEERKELINQIKQRAPSLSFPLHSKTRAQTTANFLKETKIGTRGWLTGNRPVRTRTIRTRSRSTRNVTARDRDGKTWWRREGEEEKEKQRQRKGRRTRE